MKGKELVCCRDKVETLNEGKLEPDSKLTRS